MKIIIAAVGKIKNEGLSELAEDYFKRFNKHYPSQVVELKTVEDVLSYIKTGDILVACDETGKQFSSIEFAGWLSISLSKYKRIVFLIGGADGIGKLRTKAGLLFSFSKMTFQHDIARVVLLEQLYRAVSIIKGEPYHR